MAKTTTGQARTGGGAGQSAWSLDVAPRAPTPIGAAEVAKRAMTEVAEVTGLDADHVSAVEKAEDGWHVTVDLVELRRIPAATDVLAAYECLLDPAGVLISYHRRRRYFRDQTIDEP